RAGRAIAAGCDVALHCNGNMSEMEAVVSAAGPLAAPGMARANAALSRRTTPGPIDADALLDELDGLMMADDPNGTHG
ncbi:MAG: beta-hexosaminidase, partial [Albidovulum sp.]